MSHQEQVAIVDAILTDLRTALAQAAPEDRLGLQRQIRRIAVTAIEYGLYDEIPPVGGGASLGATPQPNRQESYAEAAWLPTDIMARFGVDEEAARDFLHRNEKWIQEAMIRAGWDAIDLSGQGQGWTPRDWDEAQRALLEFQGFKEEEPPPPGVDGLNDGF
jgi:hypothetical protein